LIGFIQTGAYGIRLFFVYRQFLTLCFNVAWYCLRCLALCFWRYAFSVMLLVLCFWRYAFGVEFGVKFLGAEDEKNP